MATTAGSNWPMAPAKTVRGQAVASTVIPLDPTEVISIGDVITRDATTKDAVDSNAATTGVIGVAISGGTGATTIDRAEGTTVDLNGTIHALQIALALPGTMFAGNLCGASVADLTGVYQTDMRQLRAIQESTQGFCVLSNTATDSVTYTMAYVAPQRVVSTGVVNWGHEAGVGVVNPRVEFFFTTADTIFA